MDVFFNKQSTLGANYTPLLADLFLYSYEVFIHTSYMGFSIKKKLNVGGIYVIELEIKDISLFCLKSLCPFFAWLFYCLFFIELRFYDYSFDIFKLFFLIVRMIE